MGHVAQTEMNGLKPICPPCALKNTFLSFISSFFVVIFASKIKAIFSTFRDIKIEREVFPAGTDSKYLREVGIHAFFTYIGASKWARFVADFYAVFAPHYFLKD